MNDIGHNMPPEETIEEVVLTARQSRDMMEQLEGKAEAAEKPYLVQANEASAPIWAEYIRFETIYRNMVARISKWQEKQRTANPFADPKEVSRVIIDGEVAATTRRTDAIEIFKPDAVPRELCKPDEAKIKAALARGEDVPGARAVPKYGTMVR